MGTFSETILAVNGDGTIAVGADQIFDGTTLAVKRPLPLSTKTMAMSADGATLYLYDTTTTPVGKVAAAAYSFAHSPCGYPCSTN